MNKISIYRLLSVFITAIIIFAACTKEDADVRLDPKLSTTQVLSIKSDGATVVGFVVAGQDGIYERGVCYSTKTAPTIADNKVPTFATTTGATFNVAISGLAYVTKYYVRAYVTNSSGTIYGEEFSFTTLPVVPTLTTDTVIAKTGTSVTGGGNITNDGKAAVTERGICISLAHNPAIDDTVKAHQMQLTKDGAGTGAFTSTVTKLKGLTTYYVRAYAKNSAGVGYGQERTVTTPAGIVTLWIAGDFQGWNPGGAKDSLMNTEADPIVRGYAYISTTGGFKFVAQKSWTGTAYGAGTALGTLSTDAGAGNHSVSTAGYYLFAIDLDKMTYTATKTTWGIIGDATTGSWGAQTDMGFNPSSQTYSLAAHLTSGGALKFRGTSDWSVSYGSLLADGNLDTKDNNNIPITITDDYAITLNLSHPNAYTYSLNRWGVIGDFNGWAGSVPLTWDATNQVFKITLAITNGGFKFRANDAWTLALGGKGSGDTNPDNYTDASTVPLTSDGGKNIGAPGGVAGTYTITLDPWTMVAKVQ